MVNKSVVAMPPGMERRFNVADFARSQDLKQPPKLRTSLTRQTSNASQASSLTQRNSITSSPGRRRMSSSRDLVQEVYDRMGVNYVRGQSSTGIYDSSGSFSNSDNASKVSNSVASSSIVSRTASSKPNLSVETRNEQNSDDRQDRKSCRSARSVKSLMSAFGGGKSVTSTKSVDSRNNFEDYISTTPSEGVRDGIIDVRDDGDMDGTMSVISVESHWTNRKNQQCSSRSVMVQRTQSTSTPKAAKPESPSLSDDAIDRIIEGKLQEKLAQLEARFEEKFRRLEEETNKRLEKLEKEAKGSSKGKYGNPYQTFRL